MNFIAEFSELNKTIDDKLLDLRITRVALDFANLLLEINEETFNEIDKIILINKTAIKGKDIEKIFRNFTLFLELFHKNNPAIANQLYSIFPDEDRINENKNKANKIDELIRGTSVLKINEVFKKEEFIAYYNHASEIIEKKELKLSNIIYNGNDSKIKIAEEYEEISPEKYYEINNKVNNIPGEPEDKIKAHGYTEHPKFVNHFDSSFLKKLERVISGKDKQVFICGEDNFIALKSKDYVFSNVNDADTYDLRRGLPFIDVNKTNNVAFNYIHQLSSNNYNELGKKILPLTYSNKKILFLGEELDLDPLIGIATDNIPIPNSEEVAAVITKLFIAMLIEERKFENLERHKLKLSIIYEAINRNSFRVFFDELKTLNELYEAIKQIDEITTEDLISNVFFWIKFLDLLEAQQNKNKVKVQEPKNTLSMIFENGEWVMIFNDDELIRSSKAFMIYLDVIIQHQMRFNESIDVIRLRKGAIKYQKKILKLKPKGNIDELDEESCRKTVGKALKDFQDDYEERIKFIEEFIKYNKYEYTFYTRNIKLQEIISPIDDNFFHDLD
ncbi:MAG: hypothetical protein K8F60_04855 [Melioribacteraceae bacterium]|nr:hypothetical protein [Melioribacteraceae bacterium]